MIPMLIAGFLLGLSVAVPLGPVGATVIREGLERGTLPAFLIGLGAATVDFFYLTLVYLGVAPLLQAIPWLMTGFYLLGALLLGQMAWYSLTRAREGGLPPAATGRGKGFLFGLGITLFNPSTIVSWLGLGGAFASAWLTGRGWGEAAAALLAVFAGSLAWFATLSLAVGLARRALGSRPWVYRAVNLTAGLALAVFAAAFLWRAVA